MADELTFMSIAEAAGLIEQSSFRHRRNWLARIGPAGGAGELGVGQADAAQGADQHIGH